MERVGQPRGIQRLFHSMKRAERQRSNIPQHARAEAQINLVQQPPREPQQASQPTWENDPRLTTETKAQIAQDLRRLHERTEASLKEYKQWLENQPKGETWKPEDWLEFRERKLREQQLQNTPAPLVSVQQTPERVKTSEQRKGIAMKMYKQLVREFEDRQLLKGAKILRKEVWGDDPDNPRATVNRYGGMLIIINHKTGMVKDRSIVGVSLSNPGGNAKNDEIFFGIRYLGDKDKGHILLKTQGSVSKEDMEKGAKVYFIERTHNGVTEITLIPYAYKDSLTEFFDRLHDAAVQLAPTQARHRRQPAPQPQQLAA